MNADPPTLWEAIKPWWPVSLSPLLLLVFQGVRESLKEYAKPFGKWLTDKTIGRVLPKPKPVGRLHFVVNGMWFTHMQPAYCPTDLVINAEFVNGFPVPKTLVAPVLVFRKFSNLVGEPVKLLIHEGRANVGSISIPAGASLVQEYVTKTFERSSKADKIWRDQLIGSDAITLEGRDSVTNELVTFHVWEMGERSLSDLLIKHKLVGSATSVH